MTASNPHRRVARHQTPRPRGLRAHLARHAALHGRARRADPDEIWFLEHPPVYTLGMNASPAHVLAPGDIPVVQIDRGGQVTYHGPGQLVVYPLIDLRRAKLGVRDLVTALERSVIDYVAELGIAAECRRSAPGVYVNDRKLASVGIRIRRGSSYHGIAINVNLDAEPFSRINPCGYAGLEITRLADLTRVTFGRRSRKRTRTAPAARAGLHAPAQMKGSHVDLEEARRVRRRRSDCRWRSHGLAACGKSSLRAARRRRFRLGVTAQRFL